MFDEEQEVDEIEVEAAEPEEEPEAVADDDELTSDDADDGEDDQDDDADEPEAADDAEPDDVLSVSLGDDEPEEEDQKPWVNELRKQNRELKKRLKEMESQSPAAKATDLGPKPTLEGADYDEERFERELTEWHERKRQVDAAKAAQEEEQKKAEEEYQARLEVYNGRKGDLRKAGAKDIDDAEEEIKEIFSVQQQGVLLDAASDPALMVYALGKNPEKARKLASEKNVVKFIAELVRMETKMKVAGVKKPSPEKRVGAKGGVPQSPGNRLEKLREEAAKTGDYTKVNAYKRKLREQAK